MNAKNCGKIVFYILSIHFMIVLPFQACAPLSNITGDTAENSIDQSSLNFGKTCEASENLPYRSPLLTKSEVSYILSDLFKNEITANTEILKKVNELPEIEVNKDTDDTVFSENNQGKIASEAYLMKLIDVAQLLFDQYLLTNGIEASCVNNPVSCFNSFRDNFVVKLWRRPLLAQEIASFTAIYSRAIAFKEKLNLAFLVSLSSPQFFYKNYLPRANSKEMEYSQYFLASRLSFFLYNSIPDSNLWNDAVAGKLSDPLIIKSHVDRLLTREPYASRFVKHNLSRWLGIEDDLSISDTITNDKGVSISLKELATQQYNKLYNILKDDKNISEVFYSDKLYINRSIASYLELPNPNQYPTSLALVNAIPNTLEASYIASPHFAYSTFAEPNKTLVTSRGAFLTKGLTCRPIPVNELDPNAITLVLGPNAHEMTQIEVSNIRRNHVSCMACHKEMDKLGMGAEFVDSFGRYRESYQPGKNIEINFSMSFSEEKDVTNFSSFLKSFSQDERVHSCFVKTIFSKAAPVTLESSHPCADEIAKNNGHLGVRSYVKSIVTSKYFTRSVRSAQ